MKKLLGIELSDEQFDGLICAQNKGKQLVIENGTVIAKDYVPTQQELNEQRIYELKKNLAGTDYKAIKYAEGQLTVEEYAETKEQRQAWRDEINRLEES